MVELADIPRLARWAKNNFWLALATFFVGLSLYGGVSFIGSWATRYGETVGRGGHFATQVLSYTAVEVLLNGYLDTYNVSRIAAAQVDDNSVTFVTATAKAGLTVDTNQRRLPILLFASVLPQLADGKPLMVITKDQPDGPLRDRLTANGTRAVLFVPVRDLSNRFIGFITLSWINLKDVPQGQARAQMIAAMTEVALRIGAYIAARTI
jgi:hypothetical protein